MEQSDTDVPDDDDFLVEWDEWSEVENGRGPMADWNHKTVYDAEQGNVVASAPPIITGKCGFSFKPPKTNVHAFPCMPCINQCDEHREKIQQDHQGININKMYNTAVARPVARKEIWRMKMLARP